MKVKVDFLAVVFIGVALAIVVLFINGMLLKSIWHILIGASLLLISLVICGAVAVKVIEQKRRKVRELAERVIPVSVLGKKIVLHATEDDLKELIKCSGVGKHTTETVILDVPSMIRKILWDSLLYRKR